MANSQPLSVDVPVTYEEVSRNRDLLRHAMHQAIDLWFENLERKPLREIDQPPTVAWFKYPQHMAMSCRVEGTVYDRPPADLTETIQFFAEMTHEARREAKRREHE
jgi:hypothetical protein